jgi:hypothetical protein
VWFFVWCFVFGLIISIVGIILQLRFKSIKAAELKKEKDAIDGKEGKPDADVKSDT